MYPPSRSRISRAPLSFAEMSCISCITLVTRLLYNHQESHGLVCYQGEASLATIQIFCGFRQGLSSYDQQLQGIQSGANRFLVWMNPPFFTT